MSLPPEAFWHELADAADRESLARFRVGTSVDSKIADGGFDPVTEGDRAAERAIRSLVERDYPDHAILGEEHGATGEGPYRWVIDPIDGTRAFIAGLPTWMTLIGLERDGMAVAGLASQPVTGERFLATGEGGARVVRRGESSPLRVSPCKDPSRAIAMTTDPFLFLGNEVERHDRMRDGVRLLRYGTDAYGFCALAAGSVDIAFERGVEPYDICALIPIVEAAGGILTTWTGGRAEAGGDVVACATPALHEWALRQLG